MRVEICAGPDRRVCPLPDDILISNTHFLPTLGFHWHNMSLSSLRVLAFACPSSLPTSKPYVLRLFVHLWPLEMSEYPVFMYFPSKWIFNRSNSGPHFYKTGPAIWRRPAVIPFDEDVVRAKAQRTETLRSLLGDRLTDTPGHSTGSRIGTERWL